jgi:transposase
VASGGRSRIPTSASPERGARAYLQTRPQSVCYRVLCTEETSPTRNGSGSNRCFPQKTPTGRPAVDHRRVLKGILWILRTGAPWHDLPERYGPWRTVASRFSRWRKAGVFQRLLDPLKQQADATGQLDRDVHFLDSTMVRAH